MRVCSSSALTGEGSWQKWLCQLLARTSQGEACLMQVCTHPYLLHHTRPEEEDECEVVGVSTKWQLMDRLIPLMRAARQRILILSQSPKSLDLVEVRHSQEFFPTACAAGPVSVHEHRGGDKEPRFRKPELSV